MTAWPVVAPARPPRRTAGSAPLRDRPAGHPRRGDRPRASFTTSRTLPRARALVQFWGTTSRSWTRAADLTLGAHTRAPSRAHTPAGPGPDPVTPDRSQTSRVLRPLDLAVLRAGAAGGLRRRYWATRSCPTLLGRRPTLRRGAPQPIHVTTSCHAAAAGFARLHAHVQHSSPPHPFWGYPTRSTGRRPRTEAASVPAARIGPWRPAAPPERQLTPRHLAPRASGRPPERCRREARRPSRLGRPAPAEPRVPDPRAPAHRHARPERRPRARRAWPTSPATGPSPALCAPPAPAPARPPRGAPPTAQRRSTAPRRRVGRCPVVIVTSAAPATPSAASRDTAQSPAASSHCMPRPRGTPEPRAHLTRHSRHRKTAPAGEREQHGRAMPRGNGPGPQRRPSSPAPSTASLARQAPGAARGPGSTARPGNGHRQHRR